MMNDSVREELALKISPIVKSTKPAIQKGIPKPMIPPPAHQAPPVVQQTPVQPTMQTSSAAIHTSLEPEYKAEMVEQPVVQQKPMMQAPNQSTAPPKPIQPVVQKPQTAEIASKTTSPTLIDFRHKNAVVPEWRLHLQNAVRKRQDHRVHTETDMVSTVVAAPPQMTLATSGATALQAEPIEQNNPIVAGNPKLEAAMKRIEQSRQMYFAAEEKPKPHLTAVPSPPQPAQPKTFPYVVAPTQQQQPEAMPPKPENVVLKTQPKTFIIEKKVEPAPEKKVEKFDTNKLPPLSQIVKAAPPAESRPIDFKAIENKIQIEAPVEDFVEEADDVLAYAEAETFEPEAEEFEEIDDCAPVSLRFNAGLFDLIIGSFLSFVLLSPFMLLNGNLFTLQGLLAFLATFAIVMFIYMTVSIGFLGRTFGMRLFSLEIIDIEENDYPTFHQAAVNSCVYLFSLALGGIGFLPLFFNSEKRAAHDLLAGTIVVREEG
jgi:uncharacterized RDD family membrane protein YckC